MNNYRSVLKLLGGGAVITLVSGLYNSTPGGGFVGASWYGFPVAWLRKLVLAHQYNPWRVDASGLIADIVIWAVVIALLYFTARTLRDYRNREKSGRKR